MMCRLRPESRQPRVGRPDGKKAEASEPCPLGKCALSFRDAPGTLEGGKMHFVCNRPIAVPTPLGCDSVV